MRERRAADRDRVPGSCPIRSTGVGPTHSITIKEKHEMNLLTDILAGLIHVVGWLV
ncbi:hypothetical protein HUT18_07775 [Streptomyces sp. NA04227]|uniref:hypothetical protein n=1 Tax=Streptomyces sp. NA04227 TaxID=2742136 RepID=UPI001591679B|nr:hypothetical protein [Streptomyces sp. NA04227]QKW04958.1 hypothetical protein HUT18_07775 [Streptomyces sp. NA04227]